MRILKYVVIISSLASLSLGVLAQSASVSPSRLYYNVAPGEYKSQTVKVTNSSQKTASFTVTFGDFESKGNQGKTTPLKPGESEHSCAAWLSASPSFFELQPGETKEIQVLLQLPNTPDASKVKWATMMVKLASERTSPLDKDANNIGMGIVQSFQFVIHIFQTPPNVTNKQAEIKSFKDITTPADTACILSLQVNNTGEAILDCASYVELTQLKTGVTQRLPVKAFSMLPGGEREIKFILPKTLEKGRYSVLGVVDYGSKEAIQAAELEIEIK